MKDNPMKDRGEKERRKKNGKTRRYENAEKGNKEHREEGIYVDRERRKERKEKKEGTIRKRRGIKGEVWRYRTQVKRKGKIIKNRKGNIRRQGKKKKK